MEKLIGRQDGFLTVKFVSNLIKRCLNIKPKKKTVYTFSRINGKTIKKIDATHKWR